MRWLLVNIPISVIGVALRSPPYSLVGVRDHLLHGFLDTARTRFRIAVTEDAEQMETAVRRRHLFPASPRHGIARKCGLQYGREFDFGFHRCHEPLRHLLGTSFT